MKTFKSFDEIKAFKEEKSGKKLIAFSVAIYLLIAILVFYAVFTLCGSIRLKQMDEYFAEIPKIIDGRMNELRMHNRLYEEDLLARTELNRLRRVVSTDSLYVDSIIVAEQEALFLDDWTDILDRMLPEGGAVAFSKTGDTIDGYPLDGFTAEQIPLLKEDVSKAFARAGHFRQAGNGRSNKIVKLLGKRYLAALMHFPQDDTDVLLTVPLIDVLRNGLYISISILAIIGLGILLFQIYALRRLLRKRPEEKTEVLTRSQVRLATWPGILVVLAVTFIFSAMLLLLESRSDASSTATAGRESIQHEINWRKKQENAIRKDFVSVYRNRAQMVADFLMERPNYQTHEGLNKLNGIAQTDYLMRFDRNGQEIASSNSYTGFSVGKNLSEEYRAVLMGYPYAVVGPAADPYTHRKQLGTAILMTDRMGNPDGFLLAVYSAEDLNEELERMGYENTINNTAVRAGRIAAAINNEDGRFIAHTNPEAIGLNAKDFLEEVEVAASFEGFTTYEGEAVCVSATSADGKTLLFLVPEREHSYVREISLPVVLALLLILALLYYPIASVLVARAMDEADNTQSGDESPMRVFSDGYSTFLTLFVIFTLIATANGWWTSFDYVFSGQWSKGLNLFSLWAALFVTAVTCFIVFLIRIALNRMEARLNARSRTIARLVNSLVSYVACVFLFFVILTIFGVNTTAMLASVGIISIAVGMGAQSMAADLLAGFFMMVDGSVRVGDYVSVGGVTGHVTDMGIRTTEITDDKGNIVILNNSRVSSVCNMSRNKENEETEKAAKK